MILCVGQVRSGFAEREAFQKVDGPFRTQLAPAGGAMGYGGARCHRGQAGLPGAPVVCFAGDGCFLMSGQELVPAVQYGLKILFLVINNGRYGTLRMHQEREYPRRLLGTDLQNPDFAAYVRALGAHGETVRSNAQFALALERTLSATGPALIELVIDPDAITLRTSLTAIPRAALAKRR